MFEMLFEIGLAQGLGIFFFLFVGIAGLFWHFVKKVMDENQRREQRYIDTIDNLSKSLNGVESLTACINEFRHDNEKEHEETQKMLGRVLDRLPPSGG